MKTRIFIIVIFIIISVILVVLLYFFYTIPHKQYSNSDFNIETYISSVDKDNDGIDDQTDILNNVRTYIAKKPKYKSKYYETGYPDDEYGVCTDVVAKGIPFLIHHANPIQVNYEEDVLELYGQDYIIGHYRIS